MDSDEKHTQIFTQEFLRIDQHNSRKNRYAADLQKCSFARV